MPRTRQRSTRRSIRPVLSTLSRVNCAESDRMNHDPGVGRPERHTLEETFQFPPARGRSSAVFRPLIPGTLTPTLPFRIASAALLPAFSAPAASMLRISEADLEKHAGILTVSCPEDFWTCFRCSTVSGVISKPPAGAESIELGFNFRIAQRSSRRRNGRQRLIPSSASRRTQNLLIPMFRRTEKQHSMEFGNQALVLNNRGRSCRRLPESKQWERFALMDFRALSRTTTVRLATFSSCRAPPPSMQAWAFHRPR